MVRCIAGRLPHANRGRQPSRRSRLVEGRRRRDLGALGDGEVVEDGVEELELPQVPEHRARLVLGDRVGLEPRAACGLDFGRGLAPLGARVLALADGRGEGGGDGLGLGLPLGGGLDLGVGLAGLRARCAGPPAGPWRPRARRPSASRWRRRTSGRPRARPGGRRGGSRSASGNSAPWRAASACGPTVRTSAPAVQQASTATATRSVAAVSASFTNPSAGSNAATLPTRRRVMRPVAKGPWVPGSRRNRYRCQPCRSPCVEFDTGEAKAQRAVDPRPGERTGRPSPLGGHVGPDTCRRSPRISLVGPRARRRNPQGLRVGIGGRLRSSRMVHVAPDCSRRSPRGPRRRQRRMRWAPDSVRVVCDPTQRGPR